MKSSTFFTTHHWCHRVSCALVAVAFLLTTLFWATPGFAQGLEDLNLPVPGTMVNTSEAFVPVLLKGMTLHPDDPFRFDFIIDSGNTAFNQEEVKQVSERLIKYFLASMTVPKDDLWVNLSPFEDERIIPDELGKTELGRDLLAQDYLLKQITASLMYPEDELGSRFWKAVYKKAYELFGTTHIPVNTFNKVWIMPESATVYESGKTVYVVGGRLKVLLEEDYLALQKNVGTGLAPVRNDAPRTATRAVPTKQIVREIIIPELEREVNEGKNFAPLRQIYHSLILSKWYKQTIKESLLSKVYVDQNNVSGVALDDSTFKEQIYDKYIEAYEKGVYDFIKKDYDKISKKAIPRKYFSGGIQDADIELGKTDSALMVRNSVVGKNFEVGVEINFQQAVGDKAMLGRPWTSKGAWNIALNPEKYPSRMIERAIRKIINYKLNMTKKKYLIKPETITQAREILFKGYDFDVEYMPEVSHQDGYLDDYGNRTDEDGTLHSTGQPGDYDWFPYAPNIVIDQQEAIRITHSELLAKDPESDKAMLSELMQWAYQNPYWAEGLVSVMIGSGMGFLLGSTNDSKAFIKKVVILSFLIPLGGTVLPYYLYSVAHLSKFLRHELSFFPFGYYPMVVASYVIPFSLGLGFGAWSFTKRFILEIGQSILPVSWYESELQKRIAELSKTSSSSASYDLYTDSYDETGATSGWIGGYQEGRPYYGPPTPDAPTKGYSTNPVYEKIEKEIYWLENIINKRSSEKKSKDSAITAAHEFPDYYALHQLNQSPGGIDMNEIKVDRQGEGMDFQFDPTQIEGIENLQIESFVPVIINITPLPSILPLLGLETEKPTEELALSMN